MIDRRRFFRQFWNPIHKRHRSQPDREARFKLLEEYVRAELFPRDFDLTEQEQSQLLSRVRSMLQRSSDTEIFSHAVFGRLDSLVREIVEPWREATEAQLAATGGAGPVRQSAIGCALPFLNDAPTDGIERLKKRFGVERLEDLEEPVKREIAAWIDGMDEATLRRHSVSSIREPVFAHLKTWC